MSAEDKNDLTTTTGKDDLVPTCQIEINKVEVGESADEDLIPLVDPLSPSSDLFPTTRRYATRKRQAKAVMYEGYDSDSDEGSDWEPAEMEPQVKIRQKNIKRIKIIKIEDELSSVSNQWKGHTRSGEQTKEVKQRQRRQKQSSANSSKSRKCGQGLKEHSKTDKGNDDDGVTTEPLGRTASQPGKDVQRKRRQRSRPVTDEERKMRAEKNRAWRRKYHEKLKSAQFNVEAGEDEVDPGRVQRTQTYLERYEAQAAKRREQRRRALARMTPNQRAVERRKASMRNSLRKAAMTEEQRQEQRHKHYMRKLMRKSKKSAEELEAEKVKQRERAREHRRKLMKEMTEEQRKEYLERGRQYFRQYLRRLTPEERNARRTPEQREQKRQQTRLSWEKYELRQKLAADGVPPEQIAEKVRDFVANFVAKPPQGRIRTCRRYEDDSVKLDPALTARLEPTERQRLEDRFRTAKNYHRRKLTAEGVAPEQMDEKFKELKASYEKLGRLDGEEHRPPQLRSNETPEQRESRLMKARVAVAKFKLRKRLSARGAPPELIEEKLGELVAKYEAKAQAEITFRPHKPRAKQKRWISSESKVATTSDSPQAVTVWPTTEIQSSFSPSSPNSHGETGDDQPYCNPSPVPCASPPQMDRGAIEMSPHQQIQMYPELKMTHSKESSKFPLGNNARGVSSIPIPTLDLKSPMSKSTVPTETSLPTPPEQTTSSPLPDADFSDDDWVEELENKDSDQEEFVPPPPPKIPRRSPSGAPAKRRRGPRDGPRGSYKAAAKGPLVICDECGVGYSPDYIAKHKKLVHNPNWVNGKCVICGMEFSVGQKFLAHYSSVHLYAGLPKGKAWSQQRFGLRRRKFMPAEEKEAWKSRQIVCKLCGISLSRSDIAKHKRVEHHPDYKEGKCSVCKREFGRAVDFYEHFQREHREGKGKSRERRNDWICSLCGDGFSSFQYLTMHEYNVHGEGSKEENFPVCPLCGHKYRSAGILKKHIRNVHPEEESGLVFPSRLEWHCRRCGQKFRTNKELLEHVTAQHPDSYFPCAQCERLMYTEQNLNDHVLLCKGKEEDSSRLAWVPLPCELCSKQMRLSSLKRHYRVVHGVVEEPWRCSLCSQTFSRRDCWLNHLDGKHGTPLDLELKEEARKMNVSDRSRVEVKNLKGIRNGRIYKRKSRSTQEESEDSSEDDEDKQQRKKASEEIDKRNESENEWDTPKKKASEVVDVTLRRSTRSRQCRLHVTPEIPEVEKEKRLMISVMRMDEKEISKWINKVGQG